VAFERAPDPHADAIRELLSRPGVIRVEVGLKEIGGEPVEQWAYRVHVRRKRPLEEIPPEERLPTELHGMAVDVMPGSEEPPAPLCGSGIQPGDGVARWLPNEKQSGGTVCVVVRSGGDRYVMTNYHVLHPNYRIAAPEDREVYSPEPSDCDGIRCNKPVAHMLPPPPADPSTGEPAWARSVGQRPENPYTFDGHPYQVDVSMVKLDTGVAFTNSHSDLGGALSTQLDDLRPLADAAGPPQVTIARKRGHTTKLTQGTIVAYRYDEQTENFAPGTRVLRIRPDGNATEWTQEFEFVPRLEQSAQDVLDRFTGMPVTVQDLGAADAGRRRMRASGRTFVQFGDSGSPLVVGTPPQLAGIVFAAGGLWVREWKNGGDQPLFVYDGTGYAAYIHAAFDMVGVDPATGIVPAGSTGSGPPVAVPGDAVPAPAGLKDLDAELTGTPARERLRALAAAHLGEVFDLIHERRRVLLVWHRSKGPAFVTAIATALRQPGTPVPRQIDGVTVDQSLGALREVLRAEGGGALRDAVERDGDWLIELATRCAAAPDVRRELFEATG
jgi:hypothetical protein